MVSGGTIPVEDPSSSEPRGQGSTPVTGDPIVRLDDGNPSSEAIDENNDQRVPVANGDEAGKELAKPREEGAETTSTGEDQPSGEQCSLWTSGSIKDKLLHVVIGMVAYGVIIPIIWLSESVEQVSETRQRAAEEGNSHPSASSPAKDEPTTPAPGSLGYVLRQCSNAFRFIIRLIFKSIWRLMLAIGALNIFSFLYYFDVVTKRYPMRVLMVAFGFLNFATAAVSYLVFFDAEGTHAPAWANIFGR
jgi:hypothetical protein